MISSRFLTSITTALGLTIVTGSAQAAPITADIATIVDESGSMATEHAWLPGMISSLDTGLQGAGVTNNQYAKVGFGGHDGGDNPHKHEENSNDWFGASGYDNDFETFGGFEDGWNGIDFFFDNYTPRGSAALNLILVTDEDRDNQNTSLTYRGVLAQLASANALLNAVINASFMCGDGSTKALGIDSEGTGYVADGSGGYTTCTGASASSGDGDTIDDYVDLALATGGAAWDLNALRANDPDLADSFTSAFVDIKVQEIQEQTPSGVPAPAPLALMGLGMLCMIGSRRLRH